MQIEELAAKLQEIGLTDKQARVYVSGLFLGPAAVQKIAQQAGINRATAYVILDELADMGLVSQSIEGKKTVYMTEGPEALSRLLQQERQLVEQRQAELKNVAAELKSMERSETGKAPVVRFYKGREGIAEISAENRRKARVGSVIYAMSDYDSVTRVFPDVFQTSPNARLKKKLASKLLYSYSKELPEASLRETKRLPQAAKADISIYEDRASLMTYSQDPDNLTGIVIESPEIVGALRQIFELAWDNYKPKK